MTPKEKVLRMYPDAYVAEDVDGFWWVWTPKIRGALNGAAHETRSPGIAWLEASKRLPPNTGGKLRERSAASEHRLDRLVRPLARPGYDRLWLWFDLSYASWLTMPRVMMHAMPDDWQSRMAALLEEWDATWDSCEMPNTRVQAITESGRMTRWPKWLLDYRHPDEQELKKLKRPNTRI